jgi:hypothetical protein
VSDLARGGSFYLPRKETAMPMTYYFIGDLHIGGGEALGVCDYEAELIGFLENLATRQEDAEILIIGDIFGLWEFTEIEGLAKLEKVIEQFPNIFLNNKLFSSMGLAGNLVQMILIVNSVIFAILVALAVPRYLMWRDFQATLERFQIG